MIDVIKYEDVGDGTFWMYDKDEPTEDPSLVTISTHDGVTYVTLADADVDGEAVIVDIDDILNTTVFVPIVAPKYSELNL